jgi:hypothetical protein
MAQENKMYTYDTTCDFCGSETKCRMIGVNMVCEKCEFEYDEQPSYADLYEPGIDADQGL